MVDTAPIVSDQQRQQFQEEGYFILEKVVPDDHLQMLREECAFFVDQADREMENENITSDGINHRGKRYFIHKRYRQSKRMHQFIFSDLMAHICRATIGPNAYLFHEQWVIKCAQIGMKFAWHQDSGYVGFDHNPYLTCWCALDDVDEKNGTVYLLPYSRAGTRNWVQHTRQENTKDLVGYTGEDPGIPVIAPAGSIVAFSSTVFHCSGKNTSNTMRRIYLPQYSTDPIVNPDGQVCSLAVEFLKDGINVYDHDNDCEAGT